MDKTDELERRKLNLPLAHVPDSNKVQKIKRENALLLRRLRRIRNGPFGLWNLFRKDDD